MQVTWVQSLLLFEEIYFVEFILLDENYEQTRLLHPPSAGCSFEHLVV